MDRTGTLYGIVADIVASETKYLRHYYGQVIGFDQSRPGFVKATVPELGWTTPATAAMCAPRILNNGLASPAINDWIEVYFMGGDKNRPVYLGVMGDLRGMMLSGRTSNQDYIIFEKDRKGIRYKGSEKILTIDAVNAIKLQGDTDKAVLGNKLLTWITNFLNTAYNVHTHPVPFGTSGTPNQTGTAPNETDILTQKVKLA